MKILRGKFNPIPATYSKSLSDVVDKMLVKDYRKRPSIEELLRYECVAEKMKLYGYTVPSTDELKIQSTAISGG